MLKYESQNLQEYDVQKSGFDKNRGIVFIALDDFVVFLYYSRSNLVHKLKLIKSIVICM